MWLGNLKGLNDSSDRSAGGPTGVITLHLLAMTDVTKWQSDRREAYFYFIYTSSYMFNTDNPWNPVYESISTLLRLFCEGSIKTVDLELPVHWRQQVQVTNNAN